MFRHYLLLLFSFSSVSSVHQSVETRQGHLFIHPDMAQNPDQHHHESDQDSLSTHSRTSYDLNYNSEEEEEKQRLINQVLTLQKTLDDLSHRVDTVKEENFKLRSENQVLGQYIENLMAASNVFQMTNK